MSANTASPAPKVEAPTTNAIVTPEQSKTNKPNPKKKTSCGPFRIASQKKGVLYLRDMDSPTSIFAAVNNYKSIIDALHTENHSAEHRTNLDFRALVLHHFGTCDKFRNDFELHIRKGTSPYFPGQDPKQYALESSFHKSVRHICDKACFLRAYAPIREHCFLWRDLTISDDDQSAAELTKDQVLNGWLCRLTKPQLLKSNATKKCKDQKNSTKKQSKVKTPSICPTIFVFKNEEFSTRSKVETYLNSVYADPESFLRTDATPAPTNSLLNGCITSINPLYSPLGLLEELFLDDPWRLLVSTILLNKTQRPQVDCILFQFLQKWPDAISTTLADEEEIFNVIGVLGLGNKRSKSLIRFSKEYLELIESKRSALSNEDTVEYTLNMKEVKSLHQCGVYAWSAYQLFILKELPEGDTFEVCDHALQLYVEHKLGVRLRDEQSERQRSQAVDKKKRKRGKEVYAATDENQVSKNELPLTEEDKPRKRKRKKKKAGR